MTTRPTGLLVMGTRAYTQQFGPAELARLRALVDLPDPVYLERLDTPQARERLRDVEVIVSSWGCPAIDDVTLAVAPRLRGIFHAAGTVRSLTTEAMWDRGITLTTSASVNALPVAEFTLGAAILAGKRAPFLGAAATEQRTDWFHDRDRFGVASNRDVTIGIIGLSRIGRLVVELLRPLGWRVLVCDPVVSEAEIRAAGAEPASLDDLLRAGDIISIHAPDLPSTHHMIGARQLRLMRDHATLINTARGRLVDTEALTHECVSGRLNAMLDVTDPEPLPFTSPLYRLPNVMLTPHIAGSQGPETRRMSAHAIDELERFLRGEPVMSQVVRDAMAVMA
ncbi:hydroxyacid dehydrogenase [Pseudactinotalea sp.]|uniref:hydroxyacid dehydrogenase n=1 Tax=Pseudactinotalea sp. TaxID=1926260 RepID=UPI003B3B95AF